MKARTMHLSECTLWYFMEIFVDDGPFGADAFFRHANVQSKAVFSNATTIMDGIHGWEDEEKRVGSKFTACMCIYTKKSVDKRTTTEPSNRGVFEETNVVHYTLARTGYVLALSSITSGCQKAQFPSM